MDIEKKVDEVLMEHGITRDSLTESELEELKEEIKAKEKGAIILDGILSNPAIYYRRTEK